MIIFTQHIEKLENPEFKDFVMFDNGSDEVVIHQINMPLKDFKLGLDIIILQREAEGKSDWKMISP